MFGTGATKTIEALNKIPGLKDIPIPQLVATAPDGSGPPRGPGSGKMTMGHDDSGPGASASDSAEPTPQFVKTAPDGSDPPPSPPPSSLDGEDDEGEEDDFDFDPDDWDDSMLRDDTTGDIPPSLSAAVVPVMKCPRKNQKYCQPKTKNQDWCVPNDDTVKEAKLDDLPQDACDWNRSQFGLAEGKLGDYFGGKPNWRSHCTPAGLGDTCGGDSGSAATAAVAPSKKRKKKSHLKGLLQDASWATGDSKQQIKNKVSTAGLQVGQPY